MLRYYTLLYATQRYSTILSDTLRYSTLLYATLRYSTLLYATLRYSTPLYTTLRYSTLLYATLCYSTLLYATPLIFKTLLGWLNCLVLIVSRLKQNQSHLVTCNANADESRRTSKTSKKALIDPSSRAAAALQSEMHTWPRVNF
jgi:hypothetical protein